MTHWCTTDWCGARDPALVASTGNIAFFVIFGLFVVAMVVLVVIIIVWAVRHDVAGRRAWRQRQQARMRSHDDPEDPGP